MGRANLLLSLPIARFTKVDASQIDSLGQELLNHNEHMTVTVGTGEHEQRMIQTVIDAGYSGPIGVIDHRDELDSEVALGDNVKALEKLLNATSDASE